MIFYEFTFTGAIQTVALGIHILNTVIVINEQVSSAQRALWSPQGKMVEWRSPWDEAWWEVWHDVFPRRESEHEQTVSCHQLSSTEVHQGQLHKHTGGDGCPKS